VAQKSPLNCVELEVIGIEETKWSTPKRKPRGEYAFLNEKVEVFIFQDQSTEGDRSGQYCFPFMIKLSPNLPGSMTYYNPEISGAMISYSLIARFKVYNPHGI
jgi:hypothetical protein